MNQRRDSWRRALRGLRRRFRPTTIERRITELGIRRGDLAIDCGANIGDVSAALAYRRRGARVRAESARLFGARREARTEAQRASLSAGRARSSRANPTPPARGCRGRSGGCVYRLEPLATKGNVDPDLYVEVETIDLAQFELELDRPVKVIKIDVEGVECALVHHLLDTRAIERVETVLVELHDRHIPELQAENQLLRERLTRDGLADRVLTDWA